MAETEFHRLIIVGCGASGMAAAISAGIYENDIVILERNAVAGKKICATGNGKCNFTNLSFNETDLRGCDTKKAYSIYSRFSNIDTIDFFAGLGIPNHERNGYCYPHSGQASSVRDALLYKIEELGINVFYDTRVTGIEHQNSLFTLKTTNGYFSCSKLILATGGQAQHCFGTDGSIYYYAKKLGHTIIEPLPALVGLTLDDYSLKELAGVRHEAEISLKIDDSEAYREYGEIIFSKTGISGIPVMNSSRFAAEALEQGKKVDICLDFFKDYTLEGLYEFIEHHYQNSNLSVKTSLTGVLNNKLIEVILNKSGVKKDCTRRDEKTFESLGRIAELMKGLSFRVTGTNGFDNAQCTAGGIPLDEINSETLESLKCDGLYMTGELLDIDGKCGGYNLQWAWTTGVIAGAYAGGGFFDKNKFLKT